MDRQPLNWISPVGRRTWYFSLGPLELRKLLALSWLKTLMGLSGWIPKWSQRAWSSEALVDLILPSSPFILYPLVPSLLIRRSMVIVSP
jgi:hypothetical protein